MSGVRAAALVAVVVLLVSAVPVGSVGAMDASTGVDGVRGPDLVLDRDGTFAQENNTTVVRHRNPENRSERGDLRQVEGWLAGRMGEVLVDCTEGAAAARFGVCDLNGTYPEYLEKYVDVSGETGFSSDDNASDAFEDARENQQTFNERNREFWEIHEEYEEARENGNTARARALARELQRLDSDVNESAERLVDDYMVITGNTSVDLTESAETVEALAGNVSETTETVAADLFVETELTVRTTDSRVSFLDPLELRGQLQTVNGTALADRRVRFRIGGRTLRATTDPEGRFDLRYRPTTLPLSTDEVTVRYRPRNESEYLASRANVSVTVEQVDPDVTASPSPEAVAFGETLTVTGTVGADGVGAAGVPVAISVGGERLATVQTSADGSYRGVLRIPAGIPDGDRTVQARVDLTDRALAASNGSASVLVESTATTLGVSGEGVGPREVRIEGRLRTVDGRAVGSQTVRIQIGETVRTVSTGSRGRYATTVELPASVARNGTVPVAVSFDGTDTNLESAANETEVVVESSPPAGGDGGDVDGAGSDGDGEATEPSLLDRVGGLLSINPPFGIALAVVVLVLLVGGYWVFQRGPESDESPVGVTADAGSSTTGEGTGRQVDVPGVADDASPTTLLDVARERIRAGETDIGVIAGYAAARRRLADRLGISGPRTHWEFLASCRERDIDAEDVETFERLTEAYERAAFSPLSVSQGAARELLGAIETSEESRAQSGD